MRNKLSMICSAIAFVLTATLINSAFAQAFPTRPIRVLAGTGIGAWQAAYKSLNDEVGKILGQPVVMEPAVGAGGRLAVSSIMRASGDPHVLALINDGVVTVTPIASASFKAEVGKDYTPIILTSEGYVVITGHPSLPFRDLQGMVAYAKANPGKLNFGSTGLGGAGHFLWERIMDAAKIDLTHIPYKGGGATAMPDRLNGAVHLYLALGDNKPLIDAGKLIAVAVSGPERMKEFPNVPTLSESGLPGFTLTSWLGILAPPGIPADVAAKLHSAYNTALKMPEIRRQIQMVGIEPVGSTPAEFTSRIKSDIEINTRIIRKIGLQME